jgi:hypothetical protein
MESTQSIARAKIEEKLGENPTLGELLALAFSLTARLRSDKKEIAELSRDEKRKKGLVWQWFDRHWELLTTVIEEIVVAEVFEAHGRHSEGVQRNPLCVQGGVNRISQ